MAVVKLFNDPAIAVDALRALQSRGVKPGDIGVAVVSGDSSETLRRRADLALTAKIELAEVGTLNLSGPIAKGDSIESLADLWGVPQAALVYYESGLRRGGVIVSVHTDPAREADAKAALRDVDPFRIVPVDPPVNDRPFYLSERSTKSDERDRLFSGDFRKY